jgi:SMODS and SLOG-associating 2TM effector domain 2
VAAPPDDDVTNEPAPDPSPRQVRRGGPRQRDLTARSFPLVNADQWRRPETVLRRMYLDAEARAIEAYEWYLRDRVRKKTASRALRGLGVTMAAAGGLVPLAGVTSGGGPSGWGYVLLALAGVCVGFDHFLGLSSGWMRDMVTAQKIQRQLQEFQLDWASMNAEDAARTAPAGVDVQQYLDLLRSFTTGLSGIMAEETTEWVNEFQSGLSQLQSQTGRK